MFIAGAKAYNGESRIGDLMIRDRQLPNLFIVGAQRAGTTSLYKYRKGIKGVYMSPKKEPHYFSPDARKNSKKPHSPDLEREKYLQLFQDVTDETVIGEASPSYLWDPDSPELIHDAVPNARIIISLRDPVQRAFSLYFLLRKPNTPTQRRETLPFFDALQKDYNRVEKGWGLSRLYVELGMYSDQVKRYLDLFPRDQVKIIIFEEMTMDTPGTMREVFEFLRLDGKAKISSSVAYNAYETNIATPANWLAGTILRSEGMDWISSHLLPRSFRRRVRDGFLIKRAAKPEMSLDAKEFLENVFKDDAMKLGKILGRPLPWAVANKNN